MEIISCLYSVLESKNWISCLICLILLSFSPKIICFSQDGSFYLSSIVSIWYFVVYSFSLINFLCIFSSCQKLSPELKPKLNRWRNINVKQRISPFIKKTYKPSENVTETEHSAKVKFYLFIYIYLFLWNYLYLFAITEVNNKWKKLL